MYLPTSTPSERWVESWICWSESLTSSLNPTTTTKTTTKKFLFKYILPGAFQPASVFLQSFPTRSLQIHISKNVIFSIGFCPRSVSALKCTVLVQNLHCSGAILYTNKKMHFSLSESYKHYCVYGSFGSSRRRLLDELIFLEKSSSGNSCSCTFPQGTHQEPKKLSVVCNLFKLTFARRRNFLQSRRLPKEKVFLSSSSSFSLRCTSISSAFHLCSLTIMHLWPSSGAHSPHFFCPQHSPRQTLFEST